MSASAVFTVLSVICAAAFAVCAAARARRSIPRWSFAAGMAALALEAVCAALSVRADNSAEALTWQGWRLVAQALVPLAWLTFSLTYARGNARKFLRRAVLPLAGAAALPVIAVLVRATALSLPDGGPAFRLRAGGVVFHALFLLGGVGVIMNLERTFRAAAGTIRWRIKFMLLGVGVIFVARIYTSSQILVFRGIDPALDAINAAALIVATPLMLRSFRRAGHFDVDVYPSQSVLQGSVTLLLAGIYLVIVGALAKAVTYLGGDAAFALKAFIVLLALVAFALALQSDRARQRLGQFVSHHFQRPAYDYRAVWRKFTEATASRVDQADLTRALAGFAAEVFQTLSVNLWLANDKRDALALVASTALRDADRASRPAAEVLAHFAVQHGPADFETDGAAWAATLRELHPSQFPNGGRRWCVPLVSRGEVLGLLTLADRVGAAEFTVQDREMLQAVADHAAASLVNVQLSQSLVQAKELEAFQSMAAFFVHDLKNAASTLNLMLQNLPVHFDNPEFRADALRGIATTVTHINRLIGRLGQLRHELKIELADGDLNDVVARSLAGLEHAAGATVIKDIQPLPRIRLDGEQLDKVVTNLVLNATEAVARDGRVRVATGQQPGWVVLTVDDNGCGMSDEFVARSLFRPFQTTKKSGLGIGMFQSKMIVEAHGGRIAVASAPGKGTRFQVFLRASAAAN